MQIDYVSMYAGVRGRDYHLFEANFCSMILFMAIATNIRKFILSFTTISLDNTMKAKTFCNLKNRRDKIIRQFATNHIVVCFTSRLWFKEIV